MNARRITLILSLLFVLLCSSSAMSAWSHDPSQNNVVCDVPGSITGIQTVSDGQGGAVVVWEDWRAAPDIRAYAQRIGASGDLLWTPEGLRVSTFESYQGSPDVDSDGQGGFVITWADGRALPGLDIFAQRITSDGLALWAPEGVALCTSDDLYQPARVVGDGDGGVYAIWGEETNKENGVLHAQHASGTGDTLWGVEGIVVSGPGGGQLDLASASDGEGGLLVVWKESAAVRAQRLHPDGSPHWTAGGVLVSESPTPGYYGHIVSDGAGGAIIAWESDYGEDADIYAQRVDALGALRWTTTGVAVCQAPGSQGLPVIASDEAGGAYIAWQDDRTWSYPHVYAQHIDALGQPVWTSDGIQISSAPDGNQWPAIVADGAGGAIIAWHSGLSWNIDIHAQRVDASGNVLWASGGVTVSSAPSNQVGVRLAGDGAGGVIGFWTDYRTTGDSGIYAQQVERNGFLGYPAPALESAIDHPADQGGQIILTWDPSYLDVWPDCAIDYYSVWRRYADSSMRASEQSAFREVLGCKDVSALEASAWIYVGEVEAYQLHGYSYIVPSFGDSTGAGILWTECMVLAHNTALDDFWMSEALSGYSVDNLAPGAPIGLVAEAVGADAGLTWSASGYHDEDLSHYDVHRSAVPGFVPDESTLVGTAIDTFLVDTDPGAGAWYYRVIAEDVHGNEGESSNEASVNLWAGVDDVRLPDLAAIAGASPNPFRSSAMIAFDLPQTAEITLAVYSVDGRRVATLLDGVVEAGHQRVRWPGKDDSGIDVPSGVYFVRLEAGTESAMHKVVLLR